jgi:hypothetical protein
MNVVDLEKNMKALEISLDSVEFWITVSTFFVVIGLVVEYWFPLRELIHEIRRRRTFPRKKLVEMIGGVIVTVGVAGELWFQSRAAQKETLIRAGSHRIEALLNDEAGRANKIARLAEARAASDQKTTAGLINQAASLKQQAQAEMLARVEIEARVAWRNLTGTQEKQVVSRLAKFAGQIAECSYLANDMEAFSFSSDIAKALRAAGWSVIPPSPSVILMKGIPSLPTAASPIETLETGAEVQSTADPDSLAASHAVAQELNRLGFDAQYKQSAQRVDLSRVWITVESKPQEAQGEVIRRSFSKKENGAARHHKPILNTQ